MYGRQLPGAWKLNAGLCGSAGVWNTGRTFRHAWHAIWRHGSELRFPCDTELRHEHDAKLRIEYYAKLRHEHDAELRCPGRWQQYGRRARYGRNQFAQQSGPAGFEYRKR